MTDAQWQGTETVVSEWVTMTDPNENAFTVDLPSGWQNQAYLIRIQGVPRAVITARSPDGGVFVYVGDPNLPGSCETVTDLRTDLPLPNPGLQVQFSVPAEPFFFHYLQQRYGHTPGFCITDTDSTPYAARETQIRGETLGVGEDRHLSFVRFSFAFSDSGKPMRGRLHGITISNGTAWAAEVSGVVTRADRDPARYDGLVTAIRESVKRTTKQKALFP